MSHNKTALALMAHPDDAEFTCAGTLALLWQKGWAIHIATLTAGDCGSEQLGPEEISRIRRGEAAGAAAILDGAYHCLECLDGFIAYDPPTLLKVIGLVRAVKPTLVFAHSPQDYLIDHEVASSLVRSAIFFAGVPNVKTEPHPPFRPVPHLYYADALEGKDLLGQPVEPSLVVDVSSVMEMKVRMLTCHASQRDWLKQQHGMDEYVDALKAMAARRGESMGAAFAEGFRQHLGHGYPQNNLLAAELGKTVHALHPESKS
jgi:LmbE family N-acetylglucosaminyl deacetylase